MSKAIKAVKALRALPHPSEEWQQFQHAPFLFRWGPTMLLCGGLLLSLLFFAAAQWRIDAGRDGTYRQAFAFTQATAGAAIHNADQLLGRLAQATDYLRRAGPLLPPVALRQAFEDGLQLGDAGVEVLALDAAGRVTLASDGVALSRELRAELLQAALEAAQRPGAGRVLPLRSRSDAGAGAVVPVVFRLDLPEAAYVVYLIEARRLFDVARRSLGELSGTIRFDDGEGRLVAQDWVHGDDMTAAERRRAPATDLRSAMAVPLDWDSHRLLVHSARSDSGLLTLTLGLREDSALREFRQRVDATWLIAWVSALFVMGLVGLTAYALRRFAVKERFLRRLATVDILTGLPNRRSFQTLLARHVAAARRSGQPLALVFLDIDNFKDVNDALGHAAGDLLLKHVGSTLPLLLRAGDRICRLAGDEFTVLLPDIGSADHAERLANRLLEALRTPVEIAGTLLVPKACAGIALLPGDADNESDLMRFADTALYRAKQRGRDQCVVYDASLAAQQAARSQLTHELERAIAADELYLLYQPKVCSRSGRTLGFEALLRWRHPQRGTVFPGEFIALAEESGLIVELGLWVLRAAARQVRAWHEAGHGWHNVAVNVSALQLARGDFALRVQQTLQRYALPGDALQLELTESWLAADQKKAAQLIGELRALGTRVAVDDFGTGYSCLGALQTFKLDCLKIDRSFVRALGTPEGEEICRAVVTLGHALNMRVVAEGVETAEQRDMLVRLDCDELQGFYFAKPLPADEAVAFRWSPAASADAAQAGFLRANLFDDAPATEPVATPAREGRDGLRRAAGALELVGGTAVARSG